MHFSQMLLVNLKQAKVLSFYRHYPSRLSWQHTPCSENISTCRTWHSVKLHEILDCPPLEHVQVPLDGSRALWWISHYSHCTQDWVRWRWKAAGQGWGENTWLFVYLTEWILGWINAKHNIHRSSSQSLARINRLPNLKENITKGR